jgi:hypothetical protein
MDGKVESGKRVQRLTKQLLKQNTNIQIILMEEELRTQDINKI